RAHLDMQIVAKRRARRELVAAAADDLDLCVIRVRLWFHRVLLGGARGYCLRRGNTSAAPRSSSCLLKRWCGQGFCVGVGKMTAVRGPVGARSYPQNLCITLWKRGREHGARRSAKRFSVIWLKNDQRDGVFDFQRVTPTSIPGCRAIGRKRHILRRPTGGCA